MNEQERDRQWLGELRVVDLVDMSYGTFDLSQGSTKEWWESVEEIPMSTFDFLRGVSREALEAELRRRDQELLDSLKPQPLNAVHPKYVFELCEQYVNDKWDGKYVDDDLIHYIFEAALQAVYGQDIFERLNQRSKYVAANDR